MRRNSDLNIHDNARPYLTIETQKKKEKKQKKHQNCNGNLLLIHRVLCRFALFLERYENLHGKKYNLKIVKKWNKLLSSNNNNRTIFHTLQTVSNRRRIVWNDCNLFKKIITYHELEVSVLNRENAMMNLSYNTRN